MPEETDLRTTETGQVMSSVEGELGVHEILFQEATELSERRQRFLSEVRQEIIRGWIGELIGLREDAPRASVTLRNASGQDGYQLRTLVVERENEVPVPGLLFIPDNRSDSTSVVLVVDPRGKSAEVGDTGAILEYVRQGRIVLSIDLRGFGETADDPEKNTYVAGTQPEYRTAMIALHIGRPLLGQRVEDIMAGVDALAEMPLTRDRDVELHAYGSAGPVALHAAVLDDRISQTRIDGSLASWLALYEKPIARNHLGILVPRALMWYDLPDLTRLTGDRPVEIVGSVDAEGLELP